METTADKVLRDGNSLFKVLYSFLLHRLVDVFWILHCFCFVCEAFSVPELGVLGFFFNRFIKVYMGQFVKGLIEVDVASVKVHKGVIRIFIDSLVIVSLGVIQSSHMVQSESTIVQVEGMWLKSDSLRELTECIFKFFLFEVRQPEVVMGTCLIVF